MPAPSVAFLARHPVKGFTPEALQATTLVAGAHFPGDRLFAIENGPSGFDPAAPEHQPKFKFMVLMRMPALARLQTRFDEETGLFSIHRDGVLEIAGDLTTTAGRTAIETYLSTLHADDLRGPPKVLTGPVGFRFMDSRSGFVSLLNLASVRTIAAKAGRKSIDPARFRANIGIEGLPPWGEFDLVGKTIKIGTATLRVLKRTQRCAATHVDPKVGIRDLDLVGLLQREFGHSDCGVYAEVVESGRVEVGSPVMA